MLVKTTLHYFSLMLPRSATYFDYQIAFSISLVNDGLVNFIRSNNMKAVHYVGSYKKLCMGSESRLKE